ncbi:MAG: terminase [Pigmentiphaga sp.]|nr:terminase [Pigmentiphaga sp.]
MAKKPTDTPPGKASRTTRTRQRAHEEATARAKERFLAELERMANVSAAARKAKVPRSTAYDWYAADEEFAAAWDQAVEVAVDSLEQEAWRRARDGTLKPVFQRGEKVGQVREYSDQLMVTLLKAHKPEKYRERVSNELTGPGGAPLAAGLVQIYLPGNGRDDVEVEEAVEVQPS